MKKKTVRFILDAALTLMIVLEMLIQFTGEFLHEIIGFAFFATLLVHLLLSAKWIKNTASTAKKGKISGKRIVLAIMGTLLAINMLVLSVSSVAISGILADAGLVWAFGSYATWATVHAVSSYTLCALVALHLGMHWMFVASVLHVPYNPERRQAIGAGVNVAATAAAVALGVMAVREAIPSTAVANSTSQSANGNSSSSTGATQGSSDSSAGSTSSQPITRNDKSGSGAPGVPETPNQNNATAPDSSSNSSAGSSESEADDSSTSVTGICTLCRKRCPLSAPQCDKPYEAGLI